jgi:hypothetical protein
MGSGQMGPAETVYPPLTAEDASQLFPGQGFEIEASVESGQADQPDVHVVKVQFDDVNKLLDSPYASVHQLEMKVAEDKLIVRAREALRGVPTMAGIEIPEGRFPMPIDLEAVRETNQQFASTFRLTLPNAVTTPDARVDGRTATWAVSASKEKPLVELGPAMNGIRKATCSARGLEFEPQTPVRLGLDSLKALQAGQVGPDAVAVDQQAVIKAANVQPLRVQVVRTFDLTGDSWADDGCQLTVGLTLPTDMKPLSWKPAEVTAAADDLGTDMKPDESDDGRHFYGHHMMSPLMGESQTDQARHMFNLNLALPDSQARAIEKLTGTIEAQYPGATQVIKLDNVVAANDIVKVDPANPGSFMSQHSMKPIDNPALQERDIQMVIQQAMRVTGMTMLMITVESETAKVGQVQVFDRQGQPWPCMGASPYGGGMGQQMMQVMVFGEPEAPLSLAMTAQTGGQTVPIPFEFADLSLLPDPPEPEESDDDDDQPAE